MELIRPVQIKGGKKLFEDVENLKNDVKRISLNNDKILEIANTVSEENIEIKKEINELDNKIVEYYKENLTITESGQTSFVFEALETLQTKEIAPNSPIRVNVNGVTYFEPTFSINYTTSTLVWLDNSFTFETDDILVLEIPLKKISPDVMLPEEINDDLTSDSLYILNHFYNTYEENSNVQIDDMDYYTKVIYDVTDNLREIEINNIKYRSTDTFDLNIGISSKISKPYYKIINNSLYIASYLLYFLADEQNRVIISFNDTNYKVQLLGFNNNIEFIEANAQGNAVGHKVLFDEENNIIIETRKHKASFIGIRCSINGKFVPEGIPVFVKANYENDEKTYWNVYETNNPDVFTIPLYNYFNNEYITEPNSRKAEYKVVIPSYGIINFTVQHNELIFEN